MVPEAEEYGSRPSVLELQVCGGVWLDGRGVLSSSSIICYVKLWFRRRRNTVELQVRELIDLKEEPRRHFQQYH